MSKFLHSTGDGNDITDGSTDVLAATLSAVNLKTGLPVKTDAGKVLYSTLLDIADIDGLSTSLSGALLTNGTNRMLADLQMGHKSIIGSSSTGGDLTLESTSVLQKGKIVCMDRIVVPDGTTTRPAVGFSSDWTSGMCLNTFGDLSLCDSGVESIKCTGANVTIKGSLTMDTNRIEEVGTPVSADDAATKEYVDTNAGDVKGPGVAVDSNLCSFDTTTGKLIKDSGILQAEVMLTTGAMMTGNLQIAGTIDQATGVPLLIGPTTASSVDIGASGIDTNILGDLTVGNIDQNTGVPLVIGPLTATSVDIGASGIDTNVKGDMKVAGSLNVGWYEPRFIDDPVLVDPQITVSGRNISANNNSGYRFAISPDTFEPGITTTDQKLIVQVAAVSGQSLSIFLIQEYPILSPPTSYGGRPHIMFYISNFGTSFSVATGSSPGGAQTYNNITAATIATNDFIEMRLTNLCQDWSLYYHGVAVGADPLLLYSWEGLNAAGKWNWRIGDGNNPSSYFTVNTVEYVDNYLTVGGDFEIEGKIDQMSSVPLLIGPTTASSVDIGSATIPTEIKGDFKYQRPFIETYKDLQEADTKTELKTLDTTYDLELETYMLVPFNTGFTGSNAGVITYTSTDRTRVCHIDCYISFECDKKTMLYFFFESSDASQFPTFNYEGIVFAAGTIPSSIRTLDYDSKTLGDVVDISMACFLNMATSDTIKIRVVSDTSGTDILTHTCQFDIMSLPN